MRINIMNIIQKIIKSFKLFSCFHIKQTYKKQTEKQVIYENECNIASNFYDVVINKIKNYKSLFLSIALFEYKNTLYIKSRVQLVHILYFINIFTPYSIMIISNKKKYLFCTNNIIDKKNFLKELNNIHNCEIEISLHSKYFESINIAFITIDNMHIISSNYIKKIHIDDISYLSDNLCEFKIDVVYTYVNSKDSNWKNEWKTTFGESTYDENRYASHDELKYSLRSIFKFAPWVNNIFIVSNCNPPKWLDLNKNVYWIDHKDIFSNTTCLPTFNSHAIECCLGKINNLSEHFIYFNDDVFLNKTTYPTDFFTPFGKSINFTEPYNVAFWCKSLETKEVGYHQSVTNCKNLLKKDFNYEAHCLMQHAPHAINKTKLEELEFLYMNEFKSTQKNKVRDISDIAPLSLLYPHYAYNLGKAILKSSESIIIREKNIDNHLKQIHSYKFLCLNEYNEHNEHFVNKINIFLNERYDLIPIWENNKESCI